MRTFSHSTRGELLIAGARVALVAVALAAMVLDPAGAAAWRPLTLAILGSYALWSLIALVAAYRFLPAALRWKHETQLVDFVFIVALNAMTAGPSSPLFLFFVFLLFCSAIRFDWRVTLQTAAAALALYAALGMWSGFLQHDPDFQLNRFLVRLSYVAAIGCLLVYLVAYRERLQEDVRRLADWPRTAGIKLNDVASELVEHAAVQMRVGKVMLVWSARDRPLARMATKDGAHVVCGPAPAWATDCVARPLRARTFSTRGTTTMLLHYQSDLPELWHGVPLTSEFTNLHGGSQVLSAPVVTQAYSGRVFFVGREFTGDDLLLADITGSMMAARFDQHALVRATEERAHRDERTRVACELHDGVLQTLATVGLQLHSAERLVASRPEEAQAMLIHLEETVVEAQRELRRFVDRELRPARRFLLSSNLRLLVDHFRGAGLDFDVHVDPIPASVTEEMRVHLERLIREAITNAAKHASASRVGVIATFDGGIMRLSVSDDGNGLPFQGRYELAQLLDMDEAPKTLTRRVASLGGEMVVHSGDDGTRLEIVLPVGEPS